MDVFMEYLNLLAMFEICAAGPSYIHLPVDRETFTALRDRLQAVAPDSFLELEALVNAHASAATQEGFINGWAWAQATAWECYVLRELPELKPYYGDKPLCGSCKWFVQHYRYIGKWPWFVPVGCGHCFCPDAAKLGKASRNPMWKGCGCWDMEIDHD